jgi:hypothetical protein
MRRTSCFTAYRLLWSASCGLVGVLGLAAGIFLLPAELMFPLLFLATLVASTVVACAWSKTGETTTSARMGRAAVLWVTVVAALVACAGSTILLGGAGPGLMVVLGLTSPPAVRWCGRRLGRIPDRIRGRNALTTAELCKQWQDSYEALRVAATAAARLRIVETRQRYLDELERRDPNGLRAWLGDSASAAGDPSRFLAGEDGDAR